MKKLDKEQYIKSCIDKHGDRYDYGLVEYNGVRSKINIICKEHGVFLKNAKSHKEGQGCPKCSGDFGLTKNDFIIKYGRKDYDYSLLEDTFKIKSIIRIINKENNLIYQQWADHHKRGINPTKIEAKSLFNKLLEIHNSKYRYVIEKETYYSTDKIKIIDNLTNDIFYYRVDRHLSGMKPNKVTLNYFLIKSNEVHNSKYDYSLVNFNSISDKVDIICKEHGVFKQRVSNHMNLKDGCPKCAGVGKWNTDLLVLEFKKIHKDKFDYSKVLFENVDKKVEIICKEHGSFYQNIYKHLNGQGCRFCESPSKGEDYIKMWLDDLKINYIRQHSFETCKYVNKLSFDFYLPDYNFCIEFDGEQHFKPVEYFGGEKGFELNKKRDSIKNKWCLDNNIDLIRIKYNEVNKIKYILKERLQLVDKK
jgi:very-short-patch-repair endonuclease